MLGIGLGLQQPAVVSFEISPPFVFDDVSVTGGNVVLRYSVEEDRTGSVLMHPAAHAPTSDDFSTTPEGCFDLGEHLFMASDGIDLPFPSGVASGILAMSVLIDGVVYTSDAFVLSISLGYWPGTAYLADGSFAAPSTSMVTMASFDWPQPKPYDQWILAQGPGRALIGVRANGAMRLRINNSAGQVNQDIATGAAPGDRVSVIVQRESGVTRPFSAYQVDGGTPVVVGSSGSTGFVADTAFYFGSLEAGATGQSYEGRVHRAAVWVDGPVYADLLPDIEGNGGIRDLVDAAGALVGRQASVDALGTPVYDLDLTVDGLNAGANLGSEDALTVVGEFASGVPSTFFDIDEA